MKLTTGNGYGALSCDLTVAEDMSFTSEVNCEGYASESISYAACRFLRRSQQARNRYVTMSYKMRFAKGKGRRAKRCRFIAPAKLMELPGGSVLVTLSVDPAGVTVESVSIFLSSVEGREPEKLRQAS